MEPTHPTVLDRIDPEKRATLKKLAAGAAFVGPVVLSFSIGGLSVRDARAYVDASGDDSNVRPLPSHPDENQTSQQPPSSHPKDFSGN